MLSLILCPFNILCFTNEKVGQCGNQVGNHFWSLLLQEHEKVRYNIFFSFLNLTYVIDGPDARWWRVIICIFPLWAAKV